MTDSRLPKIATVFYGLSLVALIGLPTLILLAIFVPSLEMFDTTGWTDIPRAQWVATTWIGFIAGVFPALFMWFAVNGMRRLFSLYRQGDPLAPQAASLIKSIGSHLLAASLLGIIVMPIRTGLMSLQNPVGERAISIGINSNTLGFVMLAGLLLLIGWSMSEAHKAVAENKEFV